MRSGVLGGLVGLALLLAGCASKRYELDCHYTILKKPQGGVPQVIEKGSSRRMTSGDGGGDTVPGVGRINIRAREATATAAVLEVTFPDASTTTIELAPATTSERFPSPGLYGIRLTVDAIRQR